MTTKELAMDVFFNDNGGYDEEFCRKFLLEMNKKERREWAKDQLIGYHGNKFSDRFYAIAAKKFLEYFGFYAV